MLGSEMRLEDALRPLDELECRRAGRGEDVVGDAVAYGQGGLEDGVAAIFDLFVGQFLVIFHNYI